MLGLRRSPAVLFCLILTGCSTPLAIREHDALADRASRVDTIRVSAGGSAAPLPESAPPAVAVPTFRLIAPPPILVASPMFVWVPQWGVYVVEGHDIVYHDGHYYYWYGGRWYVSRTHRGPWTYVTERPPALANLPPGQFARP